MNNTIKLIKNEPKEIVKITLDPLYVVLLNQNTINYFFNGLYAQ